MASKLEKKMTFRMPKVEWDRLEAYSQKTGRNKTDIIREFLRTLPELELEPESG